ncbi:putative heme degradation protein [Providencia alcalifaciens]|nr:putative heme degradation protein [Providencia alcalifaciens]
MKRFLLAVCFAPIIAMGANEPLNISKTAINYCDITGQALNDAYASNKTSNELTTGVLSQLKSKNVDLAKLETSEGDLQKNLDIAIKTIRDNKDKFKNQDEFAQSLKDSISACKIQTELLLNKSK